MHLRREREILKAISDNPPTSPLPQHLLKKIESSAQKQLQLSKITTKDFKYFSIRLFFLLTTFQNKSMFYKGLSSSLSALFGDAATLQVIQQKWSKVFKSNLTALFRQIAKEYETESNKKYFEPLYSQCMKKLFTKNTLSKIQEKYLEPFLINTLLHKHNLTDMMDCSAIRQLAESNQKAMLEKEPSITLTESQFLKYCVFKTLRMNLPHDRHIYSHLLRTLNPKLLLPFQRKGTQTILTSEMLSNPRKIHCENIWHWAQFDFEEEAYLKVRKAVSLQAYLGENKAILLMTVLRPKITVDLSRNLNIFDKKFAQIGDTPSQQTVVDMLSQAQLCLYTLQNNSDERASLESTDIGSALESSAIEKDVKARDMLLATLNLYFVLLARCKREGVRVKYVERIANYMTRIVVKQNDSQFTQQGIQVMLLHFKEIQTYERTQFLYSLVQQANKEWEVNQEFMLNQQFGKLDGHVVEIIGRIVAKYGFDDYDKHHLKTQKLEFFYILGLSHKHTQYFESKKKLSRTTLDISPTLFHNSVFTMVESRRNAHSSLKNYLVALYGEHNPDYDSVCLVVDEIMAYRMQDLLVLKKESFYSVLVNFLVQAEAQLLPTLMSYFRKIRKSYMLQELNLRYKDESRQHSRAVICQDITYLIEGCLAANHSIRTFCLESLKLYIAQVPQMGFYTDVLTAFAECLSLVQSQWIKEYESCAIKLIGRSLTSGLLLPTTRKELQRGIVFILHTLYTVLLRAYCIDDDYLKTHVQYLVQRSNALASAFGWKFLSHTVSSFRDRQTARTVLSNNTCSWFTDRDFFSERVSKIRAEDMLLDVNLWPVHNANCTQASLKKLISSIEAHIQTQFIPMPTKHKSLNIDQVIGEVKQLCGQTADRVLVYQAISRIKLIYIDQSNVSLVMDKVMEVCKKTLNKELLKHVLQKVVPYLYSACEYTPHILTHVSHLLHYTVTQLNRACEVYGALEKEENIFDIALKGYGTEDSTLHELVSFHRLLVRFLGEHMHVSIAKAFPLGTLLQILSNTLHLKRDYLQMLPLESVCHCLRSQLELVNVLKYSLECGDTDLEEAVVDDFYFKTIRMGLFHFEKKKSFYDEQLLEESKTDLREAFDLFIHICDYLRNDDYHRLVKRKLPKKKEVRPLYHNQLSVLRYALLYLIAEQMDRCKAYAPSHFVDFPNPYSLTGKTNFISPQQIKTLMNCLPHSSILTHNLLTVFGDRIADAHSIRLALQKEVINENAYFFSPFLLLCVEAKHIHGLRYWRPPDLPLLLHYLDKGYAGETMVQKYVCYVVSCAKPTQLLFYLPQLFQTLAQRPCSVAMRLLLALAHRSPCFAHQLIWTAQVQSSPTHIQDTRPNHHLNTLTHSARLLKRSLLNQLTIEQMDFFKQVDSFYERVTAISGKMAPNMTHSEKKEIIKIQVNQIIVSDSVYLPINPEFRVLSIDYESGTPMQSAAKCPFLLKFNCARYEGPDQHFKQSAINRQREDMASRDTPSQHFSIGEETPRLIQTVTLADNPFIKESFIHKLSLSNIPSGHKIQDPLQKPKTESSNSIIDRSSIAILQEDGIRVSVPEIGQQAEVSCIFKVFDDIRQDCLALQIIRLFQEIYQRHKLDLKLFPYHTIANRTGPNHDIGGIIEVVPNAVSRDSLGKTNEESLYEFFVNNFGPQHGILFQQARSNFIRSQAAYSVVSYLLQIKDRHNGNILIEKEKGYLIHIDFGFILDISPGRNMRFERAQFKLTEEMIEIMGGSVESEAFQLYVSLVVKGFLTARRYNAHILAVVGQMENSGLPCFREKSMENLKARFVLEMNDSEAAQHMRAIIADAADHWTTNWYDRIQWMQQKIYH